MADTDDDEQIIARKPRVPARGADGVPELAKADDELRVEEEHAEAGRLRRDEDLELDDREERELREARQRRDQALDNDAEIADAMRRADFAERNHRQLRAKAADERLLARSDSAHAAHLRDGAVGRDDAQSDADLKAADRAQARANHRDRLANDDDRRADWNYAEGREQRLRAEQPPAAEAVRNAPEEPPVARKNVKRPRRLEKKNSKALRDFGLGD
ncbi:hypothetical protein [Kribbella sp. CA-293567]|uniref:hypothetical protein n=1 Tax=Kribbella sp. CA-293567 TaxID=3002436 RepID=UPI0022DE4CD3|nr:hypothetical protein [Kribbella sp. CA-293567]WBQ05604.1 hypothetical protein OX958_02115 [Kribbella sp. CA-293567]